MKLGDENSNAKKVSKEDGGKWYPAGPPYIGTARDMHQISTKWCEFVPKVHKEYPNLLAEMFAYCIAAAHLKLEHMLIDSLMISNVNGGGEGWPHVDAIPDSEICSFASNVDTEKYPVPSVIHYCQRYIVSDWFFGKRKVPKEFFTCDAPLYDEPPMDLAEKYDYKVMPNGEKEVFQNPKSPKHNAFIICLMTHAMNEAGTFFKKNHCDGGNKEKKYKLFYGK
eukprot:CAMPEP_0171324352 /NCGR_PEP_ID=MMETSP0816-20121228/116129_1 /TAXON_ID=420281 /ORGANISM="Proboscia inermis, Strain CCAP1064/1" /LENGTH=222 /DNA_ID=CAMNT_0011823255 /DNA_START=741 /DNA_END=1410 /DNA_ORIENTATION=-